MKPISAGHVRLTWICGPANLCIQAKPDKLCRGACAFGTLDPLSVEEQKEADKHLLPRSVASWSCFC